MDLSAAHPTHEFDSYRLSPDEINSITCYKFDYALILGVFVGAAGENFERLWPHNDGFHKEIHQRVELLSPSRLSSTHPFKSIPPPLRPSVLQILDKQGGILKNGGILNNNTPDPIVSRSNRSF